MILPLWINKISLAILLACKTSCVTRITFTPIELTFFNILSITLVDWGSRLLHGSSNSSKFGLIINALIIANNCCCPIERVLAEEDLYSYKFEIPGIYFYQCTPHKGMGMIALVVVGGNTSNKDAIAKVKVVAKAKKKLQQLIEEL